MTADPLKAVPTHVKETAEQIWLAGMGALTLARTEGTRMFETLVDLGTEIDAKLPSPADAARTATATASALYSELQTAIDLQVTAALQRAGIPTRDEIEQLTKRIEQLTHSIEALKVRK